MPSAPQTITPLEELVEEFFLCARYGEFDEISAFPVDLIPSLVLKKDAFTGNTALMLASANGHIEIVKLLLGWAINHDQVCLMVNLQNQTGSTALHWAGLTGQVEVTDLLIKSGADANIKNSFGDRPFDEAIKRRAKPEICELLARATDFNNDAQFAPVEGGDLDAEEESS